MEEQINLADFIEESKGKISLESLNKSMLNTINIKGKNNRTALMLSCFYGNIELAKRLIIENSNIYEEDDEGYNSLYYSVIGGNLKLIKLLTESKQENYNEALLLSCMIGNKKVTLLLIHLGAKINFKDGYERIPINQACLFGKVQIVKFLLKQKVLIEYKFGNSSLLKASQGGKLDIVKLLYHNNANLNTIGVTGEIPLLVACTYGHYSVMKFILKISNNILNDLNYFSNGKCTALHSACFSGNYKIIEYLIDSKANMETKDRFGRTPLHILCEKGYLEIVKLLCDRGANIEAMDFEGNFPLHSTVSSGRLNIIEYLLEKGANIQSKSYKGKTPLEYAIYCEQLECAEFLKSKGAQ